MTPSDILAASHFCQITKGEVPTLIALHPSDFEGFGYKASVTFVCGIRCVPCPDTEPGTVEILLPKIP